MKLVPLLLLAWISSGAAQTFHIEPASPILVGEPLSIRVDGLPADRSVTLTAERAMPGLYRSQAVFSVPQGTLELATAKPLSGTYTEADIRGLFWSTAGSPADCSHCRSSSPRQSTGTRRRPQRSSSSTRCPQ